MRKKFNPEKVSLKYPKIPILDIHYYGLKGYGIADKGINRGHPKFHIIDEWSLFSVAALISSPESPYRLIDTLKFDGGELPFKVKYIGRVHRTLGYFYYRGIQEWIPTLNSDTILSTNFNPNCSGCSFCSRIECSPAESKKSLKNISGKEGIELVVRNGVNLKSIDKITVVTGIFKSEEQTINQIRDIAKTASGYGFKGRILYIGSQIRTPEGIKRILETLGNIPFKYAYTTETFTNRDKMHHSKRISLEEAIHNIHTIKEGGVENLEYTYIPGIDSLEKFLETAPKLVGIAKPHLSIFRPATKEQSNLPCAEFLNNPVDYLCQMRFVYERLYGGQI